MFENFEFVNPQFFWLYLLLPGLIVWYIWNRKKQTATLKISSIKGFKTSNNWLAKVKPMLFVFRFFDPMIYSRSHESQDKTTTECDHGNQ